MSSGLSWRAGLVWRRNAEVTLKTWHLNLLPPLAEPLFYILAFGAGMGALVKTVPYHGRDIPYIAFVAPGMVGVTMMFQAYFECTFGSFIRMYYQKTFDAIIATPCSLADVAAGEIAWGATRSLSATALMLCVLWPFGLAAMPQSLWMLPLALAAGWCFAAAAFCLAALVPHIDTFNIPMHLVLIPMFTVSETFFPLPASGWLRTVGEWMPLTHVTRIARAAALGEFSWALAWRTEAALVAAGLGFSILGLRLMRRRLIP